MKLIPLLLISSSLIAQQPQSGERIPREPSTGESLKTWAPAAQPNAPATSHSVAPQTEPMQKAASAAVQRAIEAVAATEQVLFDQPSVDAPLWAVGANYKASFSSQQWSYIAQPTAGAEHLQPLTFRLASATVGQRAIGTGSGVAVRRDGNRVQLQHGEVLETLELSPRAIEQTFTFTSLPTRGELVLAIELDTELNGAQDGTGLRFTSPWMNVGYTGAIAIDADGDRIAATTRLVDGHIEIRVPEQFVASADLPLVIDPLVSSGTATSSGNDAGNPDLVCVPSTDQWHVTYQVYFGATSWDCYVVRLNSAMTPVGSPTVIDVTSNSWRRPRIAHQTGSSLSMVVGELRVGSNVAKVSGRILNSAGVTTTTQFDISTASVDSLVPDIGADPYPGIGYFTVVWEHAFSATDHDIYLRQVTSVGALRGTSPTYVQTNTANQTNPSISKSDGGPNYATQRYAVAYQQQAPALDWDIYGAMLTWDGTILLVNGANTFAIDTSVASTVLPNVSSPSLPLPSGLRNFLCVYESVWSNAGDIEMSAFDSTGTVWQRGNVVALEGDSLRLSWPQRFPSVDCDGARFAVAYHENYYNSTADLDARVATVSYGQGQLFAMDSAAPGFTSAPEFAAQIASVYATTGAQSAIYATVNDRDSTGYYAIEADRYDSSPTGTTSLRSTSCGGGVQISSVGNPIPGSTVTLALTSTGPIAGFVAGGSAALSLPGCSCIVGVDSYFTTVATSLAIAIPATANMIGVSVSVQGWMLGFPGTSCLSDIHLSNTVDLVVR